MSDTFICNFCGEEKDVEDESVYYGRHNNYFECLDCDKEGVNNYKYCLDCNFSRSYYKGPMLCPAHLNSEDMCWKGLTKASNIIILSKKYRELTLSITSQKPFKLYGEEYQVSQISSNIKPAKNF